MASPLAPQWRLDRDADGSVLRLSGEWMAQKTGLRSEAELRQIAATSRPAAALRVDASAIGRWDSALVAFLARLDDVLADNAGGPALDINSLPSALARLLALTRANHPRRTDDMPAARRSLLDDAGMAALICWEATVSSAELIGVTVLSTRLVLTGRLQARAVDVVGLMRECGFGALGIAAIVNGLVGAILGFVGAVQLRRFGAEIYVTNLVGVAVVREMAPIMTAIVMAGRTGGSYAAQIATMQGNEEVDALQALGISVNQFLVIPRVIAAVTMVPVLTAYGCFMGLFGGLIVGVAMLNLSPMVFLEHLQQAVPWTEFAIGFTKTVCFGALIALVGCRRGLAAGRSAADVGRAATSAVVDGIIGIIVLDAIFAACAEALGI